MDEIAIIIAVFAVVGLPLILSIIALVFATQAKQETRRLRSQIRGRGEEPVAVPAVEEAPKEPLVESTAETKAPPPLPVKKPAPPPAPKPKGNLEVAIGGKLASLIGIVVLVMGVVFFVGYAIQQNLIGPGVRILLGLGAGGLLVFLGFLAETKGKKKLGLLARALTGGGSALFYFTVYAAYAMYTLIGSEMAIVGLVVSALAVLGLALAYSSQSVAMFGVVGAFVTPLLIGANYEKSLFPLIFFAVINVPVIALGVMRKWQWLYNTAFAFTAVFTTFWLGSELTRGEDPNWIAALSFVMIYFLQFALLGCLKLRGERAVSGRAIDLIRLLLNSLCLLGALYWILKAAELQDWLGAAFISAALLHLALTRFGWTWLPSYKQDTLAFLIGGLTFAALALPAQLDGAYVSAGWAIEGLILAWYANRVKSMPLRIGGMMLGLIGLGKSVLFDFSLYEQAPAWFLNDRFFVGMASALLLGLQGRFAAKASDGESGGGALAALLGCLAASAFVLVVLGDGILTRGADDPITWLVSSLALILAAVAITATAPAAGLLYKFGIVLLAIVPLKLLFFDMTFGWLMYDRSYDTFKNTIFIVQLAMLVAVIFWAAREASRHDYGNLAKFNPAIVLYLVSIVACVVLVTMEFYREDGSWVQPIVTLWWGLSASVIVALGFRFRRRFLRLLALVLFGLTLGKIFIVDLAALGGLQRVAAFMGVGVLLLVVSLVYQRVAPRLLKESKEETS